MVRRPQILAGTVRGVRKRGRADRGPAVGYALVPVAVPILLARDWVLRLLVSGPMRVAVLIVWLIVIALPLGARRCARARSDASCCLLKAKCLGISRSALAQRACTHSYLIHCGRPTGAAVTTGAVCAHTHAWRTTPVCHGLGGGQPRERSARPPRAIVEPCAPRWRPWRCAPERARLRPAWCFRLLGVTSGPAHAPGASTQLLQLPAPRASHWWPRALGLPQPVFGFTPAPLASLRFSS